MTTSELDNRNITISMRKSVENLVISSQDAIGQSISQALSFSGVITQHTNQILQETRSVSRSPSPALRLPPDFNTDNADCDKTETASAGGDGLSISSSEAIAGPNKNSDIKLSGAARGKKKSWYSSLYPTYKSRSDDFKRLFKDVVPEDERLIVEYSCALQKDILAHGRLYASQRYLCFHANIFGWETSLAARWTSVQAITKEKTALVIPNAILICTDSDKHFFTSFSGRDKSYLMLFRIWQNALMDQPVSTQEIWQWVHSCYGEELGFNSDDEGYSRELDDDKLAVTLPIEELVETSSMEAVSGGVGESPEELRVSRNIDTATAEPMYATQRSYGEGQHRDETRTPQVSTSNGGGDGVSGDLPAGGGAGGGRRPDEEGGDTLPTDISDSSDSDADKHRDGLSAEKCTSSHEGRLLLQQQFAIGVDQMFTMLFTNSKFYLEVLATRGARDYVQEAWSRAAERAGDKRRQLSYTLALAAGPLGPKEVFVTETQTMNKCSNPGVLYSIDISTDNARIPYADHFSVENHYCLQRVSDHATLLSVYAYIKYKKNVWPVIKGFLEKNTMAGLEEYARVLRAALAGEGAAPGRKPRRLPRRKLSAPVESGAVALGGLGGLGGLGATVPGALGGRVAPPAQRAPGRAALLLVVVLLLVLNAVLYWRLTVASGPARPAKDYASYTPDYRDTYSGAATSAELREWRRALAAAVRTIHQTEQSLRGILESLKPSLEKAKETSAHSEL